jgi:hypothetical protein
MTAREPGPGTAGTPVAVTTSRAILAAHGGTVGAEPREAGGLAVTVTLPAADPGAPVPDLQPAGAERPASRGPRRQPADEGARSSSAGRSANSGGR